MYLHDALLLVTGEDDYVKDCGMGRFRVYFCRNDTCTGVVAIEVEGQSFKIIKSAATTEDLIGFAHAFQRAREFVKAAELNEIT